MNNPWLGKYIGRSGLNCWDLVREIYFEHWGIQLPTYGEIDTKELWAVAKAVSEGTTTDPTWTPVERAHIEPLDVVIMRGWLPCADKKVRRGVVHAGLVSRPGHVLHTNLGYTVVEVPFTSPTVRSSIVG